MTTEYTESEFVYIGYESDGTSGAFLVGIRQIIEGGLAPISWYKSKPALKNKIVGGVYKIRASATAIDLDSIKYAGRIWQKQEDVIAWRLATDIAETRARIASVEKKDKARDVIAEALDPILKLYKGTDRLGRRALEALILEKLRKGV